jgi:MarR family transcriptional regulator, organic hydroperoxide resistance regulator
MKQDKLVAALRLYGASHVQLTRAFADSLGLHSTDAAALSEIIYGEDRGSPTSPAELARKLAISKPALSACINRLEEAGHIVRCRESSDRRVITLRCSPSIYQHVDKFFGPVSARMGKVVEELSGADVDLIQRFLQLSSKAVSPD